MAKKLVERSFSDPAMFVVTYKAEHNHPVPTHRNSLAGSTRNKLVNSATSTAPTASMVSSSSSKEENKLLLQQTKQESREDTYSDHLVRSSDDLFMGLEVLTGSTNTTTLKDM
ncbi:DNA-binding WRKY [Macleaya cordata]|uniref:DNA-binding WRKY n=1 Tax=Macleaya cordata TaxID=56857 RepID=A0A200QLK3_MACCD|nr:DNA-binding WRKY [Macleaya cordata]